MIVDRIFEWARVKPAVKKTVPLDKLTPGSPAKSRRTRAFAFIELMTDTNRSHHIGCRGASVLRVGMKIFASTPLRPEIVDLQEAIALMENDHSILFVGWKSRVGRRNHSFAANISSFGSRPPSPCVAGPISSNPSLRERS